MQSVRLMAQPRIRRIGGAVPQIAASFGIQHGSEHSQRMHPVLQTARGHRDILEADPASHLTHHHLAAVHDESEWRAMQTNQPLGRI